MDKNGAPLHSHVFGKWIELGLTVVGDVIDDKGDVSKALYPLIPPQVSCQCMMEWTRNWTPSAARGCNVWRA